MSIEYVWFSSAPYTVRRLYNAMIVGLWFSKTREYSIVERAFASGHTETPLTRTPRSEPYRVSVFYRALHSIIHNISTDGAGTGSTSAELYIYA